MIKPIITILFILTRICVEIVLVLTFKAILYLCGYKAVEHYSNKIIDRYNKTWQSRYNV